jgi:hypothetical protein
VGENIPYYVSLNSEHQRAPIRPLPKEGRQERKGECMRVSRVEDRKRESMRVSRGKTLE